MCFVTPIAGIYGFVFFPTGWTSFRKYDYESADKYEFIRGVVGNYSYLALVLILTMQFAAKIGVTGLPHMFASEVFPFKYVVSLNTVHSPIFVAS